MIVWELQDFLVSVLGSNAASLGARALLVNIDQDLRGDLGQWVAMHLIADLSTRTAVGAGGLAEEDVIESAIEHKEGLLEFLADNLLIRHTV